MSLPIELSATGIRAILTSDIHHIAHHLISKYTWRDGETILTADATVHGQVHSLHYSGNPFEGIRIYKGHALLVEEHAVRLIDGILKHGGKVSYTMEELAAAVRKNVADNTIVDGYSRPIFYRGPQDITVGGSHASDHLAITSMPLPSIMAHSQKLHIVTMRRSGAANLAETKSSELFAYAPKSKQEAYAAGSDDALYLDTDNFIADSTAANVFFVFNGKVFTPGWKHILPGITQKIVFKLLTKRGIEYENRNILPSELAGATEAFMCGTAAEISPIAGVSGIAGAADVVYPTGSITRQLTADYFKLVQQPDADVRRDLGLKVGELLE